MNQQNRQAARTRSAIRTAFAELVFTRRYGDIKMVDVARAANVGRSTLYLHYPDKDAILLENMAPLLSDLASATGGVEAMGTIEAALSHVWSHRDRGRVVLFGTTGQKLEAALAARIAQALPIGPVAPPFTANALAATIFSVMRTWLKGEASSTAPDLARYICTACGAVLVLSQ